MGRLPCCDEMDVKKGPWTSEEDEKLVDYIQKHGIGSWRNLPKGAGLRRCGKSCRLRWTNYLRPDIKRGKFSEEEERLIIHLHSILGNKWSMMAARLPGRTDNEIKNYWNTHLKKKLLLMGIDPVTHRRRTDLDVLMNYLPSILAAAAANTNTNTNTATGSIGNLTSNPLDDALRLQADAANSLARFQMLQTLIQTMTSPPTPPPPPPPPGMDALNLLASFSLPNYQLDRHQLEALKNGSLVLGQDQMQALNLPAVSNYTSSPHPSHSQPHAAGSNVNDTSLQESPLHDPSSSGAATTVESNNSGTLSSSPAATTSQSTSSENLDVDCVEELSNSYSSSPFIDAFWQGPNLGGLDDDFSWKDMFDQISWPNELYCDMGANHAAGPC